MNIIRKGPCRHLSEADHSRRIRNVVLKAMAFRNLSVLGVGILVLVLKGAVNWTKWHDTPSPNKELDSNEWGGVEECRSQTRTAIPAILLTRNSSPLYQNQRARKYPTFVLGWTPTPHPQSRPKQPHEVPSTPSNSCALTRFPPRAQTPPLFSRPGGRGDRFPAPMPRPPPGKSSVRRDLVPNS